MTRKALKLSTTGKIAFADLDVPEGSLRVLQEGVGGYIERVMLDGFDMYVNSDGKQDRDLSVNPIATELFAAQYGLIDLIVGDVVLTGEVDDEGDITDLPKEIRQRIISKVAFD